MWEKSQLHFTAESAAMKLLILSRRMTTGSWKKNVHHVEYKERFQPHTYLIQRILVRMPSATERFAR